MINLIFENNAIFLYKIEDWEVLRKEYRIIGEFVGANQYVPALPLKILPEEALLLVEKKVANVISYKYESKTANIDKQSQFKAKLLETEREVYKSIRRKQIEHYFDKILEGKRKKGDNRNKEDILEEELTKAVQIDEDNMLWPLLLDDNDVEKVEIHVEKLYGLTSESKYLVYKDLWEKGYYITSGFKFGGDFLLYKGDPILFHALYIVKYLANLDEFMFSTEIVALGRLGSSVKKKGLLATVDDGRVKYISLNWIDS